MTAEWVHVESTGWKPIAEAGAKENSGVAWRVATLAMGCLQFIYNCEEHAADFHAELDRFVGVYQQPKRTGAKAKLTEARPKGD